MWYWATKLNQPPGISFDRRYPLLGMTQGIQDLLICLEMLVAAVLFLYAFPVSDYLKPVGATHDHVGEGHQDPLLQVGQRG
ncbi:unnamed protein product, partial [Discosporangium mesarthrocarpum]